MDESVPLRISNIGNGGTPSAVNWKWGTAFPYIPHHTLTTNNNEQKVENKHKEMNPKMNKPALVKTKYHKKHVHENLQTL